MGIESCRKFSIFIFYIILDGYTADQVRYEWFQGQIEALKLHKIRLPDFRVKEAFVTSELEGYATGKSI